MGGAKSAGHGGQAARKSDNSLVSIRCLSTGVLDYTAAMIGVFCALVGDLAVRVWYEVGMGLDPDADTLSYVSPAALAIGTECRQYFDQLGPGFELARLTFEHCNQREPPLGFREQVMAAATGT